MSQARVYTTKGPVRKDGLTCGKCGDPIRKGIDRRRTFSVGFRGFERTRCMKDSCTPTRAELESSATSSVYAAIDGADIDSASSYDDLIAIRDEIVSAIDEVVSEYEGNEMLEINYDLQERKDQLENASSELAEWEPDESEPEQGELDEDESEEDFEARHQEWLDNARASLSEAVGNLEIP